MNDFVICSTRSMRGYCTRVISNLAKYLSFSKIINQINGVDLLNTDKFANGEMEVTVNTSIRGKDVVLFTSCSCNEAGIGAEEAKIELYHAVDALKRSQAGKIIVFEPFISCSRSDRTTRRSSVGLWVHLKILSALGVKHIVTFQLHSDKSRAMIDPVKCAIDDIPSLNLLKQYLCGKYIKTKDALENNVKKDWAFCSVDAGGEKLARIFANSFSAPLVVAHKQRDYSKPNTVDSIHILTAEPVEGKSLWIVDDMIDTAGSVEALINALYNLKPKEINIIAVHAIFSPPAEERLSSLVQKGLLNRLIVTDTINCSSSIKNAVPNTEIVNSTELAADIIKVIICNESMSRLLQPFNVEEYFAKGYPCQG